MRHFLAPGAIAPHPLGMFVAPGATVLVAPASLLERSVARQARTFFATVDLATVARGANEGARTALHTRAKEESAYRFGIHRLAP
jgi:hypothetical protein